MSHSSLATEESIPATSSGCPLPGPFVTQDQVIETGKDWHRSVLADIRARLSESGDFPCVFSRNAFQKGLLRFIFVDSLDEAGFARLAAGLTEYVDISGSWDGNLATAYPLIVAFSLDLIDSGSVEDYHAFGWNVLQKLHEIDPAPWPEGVGKNPDAPSWSMCFNGMPIFCNMSHPAHLVRRSRNLGDHFIFVINPRERFDIVAGDTPPGRRVRANIRNRILRYDGTPHSPQLASYGAGGIEWWQYEIAEDNVERTDKCPFAFNKT
ncbi:hypothetical protein BLA39750_02864 [Burkholderia lata]|uniref:YqcI/YcgG family protein n=1 Tax=Burkholderia lata (strain ATCC 17760 / DSM 23089 / LMG 22485 / NCIMB 9086 / R18194 / 383) TaxID=482957 RepID=A0A6P2X871_BURL3|nr:YqcI/YcgG family protein [Burkholderia lata]VWD05572.1 hypothetical protein BLA39750_02864 [Burkholderia lata]